MMFIRNRCLGWRGSLVLGLLCACGATEREGALAGVERAAVGGDVLRRAYDDEAVFEQLSGAMQSLLEIKFGRKVAGGDDAAPAGALSRSSNSTPENVPVNDPTHDLTAQDTQSETTVVLGGRTVVVAYNDSGSYGPGPFHFVGWSRSSNGGASFTDRGRLPDSDNGDAGDPVMARDALTGTIYLTTLCATGSCLQVFRSFDDGMSFTAPTNGAPGTSGLADKPWLTVDNATGAGAGRGNLYLAWRDFYRENAVLFSRSLDGGASFSPPGGVVIARGGMGPYVAAGRDHEVYVFWWNNGNLYVRKSIDQGVSFGPAVHIADLNGAGTNGDLALYGDFRTNCYPHAAVNPASGDLYVVYNDCSSTPCYTAKDHANVFFTQSSDGGASWSPPRRVNDDIGDTDQFMPTIAVAPGGRQLLISFYDRRLDPTNWMIDRFAAAADIDSAGAVTFRKNERITSQSFPPVVAQDPAVSARYMGDYDQIAADKSGFYVPWSDNRNPHPPYSANQPDVYIAHWP